MRADLPPQQKDGVVEWGQSEVPLCQCLQISGDGEVIVLHVGGLLESTEEG